MDFYWLILAFQSFLLYLGAIYGNESKGSRAITTRGANRNYVNLPAPTANFGFVELFRLNRTSAGLSTPDIKHCAAILIFLPSCDG